MTSIVEEMDYALHSVFEFLPKLLHSLREVTSLQPTISFPITIGGL